MKIIYNVTLFIFLLVNFAIGKETNLKSLISEAELSCAEKSYKTLKKKGYDQAINVARSCSSDAVVQMINWQAIIDNKITNIDSSLEFFLNSVDFPQRKKQAYILEQSKVFKKVDHDLLIKFFKQSAIQTTDGYNILASMIESNQEDHVQLVQDYLLSSNCRVNEFLGFVTKYKKQFIEEDFINKKIANLLWQGKYHKISKLLPYTNIKYQKLFEARILFIKNYSRYPNSLYKVSDDLINDEGLIYNIVKWLEKRDQDTKITKYLLNIEDSIYPKKWFSVRVRNARFLIQKKEYIKAYKVISQHNLESGSYEYAESEWFSGWIALRFLNKAKIAKNHFEKLYNNVGYAVSLSRGAYWLGRSYAAMMDYEQANKWYKIASQYSATYYGQMAILEINNQINLQLPEQDNFVSEELKNFLAENNLAKIAAYYIYIGENKQAINFLTHIMKEDSSASLAKQSVALISYSNNYEAINKIARFATRFNVITLANYPVIKQLSNSKQNSLIMSIIKQESGFNKSAISSAGAVGFMQLMPQTAKEMARRMKIPFSKRRLKTDAKYNIKLGSYYINHLLNRFDNSYVLAIASYNAGPTNTKRWIKDNGDPRGFTDRYEVIDWIEKITFPETRNYVQRIVENSVIYSHLIK